jgi:pimeloyl-ACP methyl ester carboxylesterase
MSNKTTVPVGTPAQAISVRPVVLPAPDRGHDLEVRVSAPASGCDLPVVVFSHGFGWSMDGYGPVADYWAAHGFVVVQPTHLDSTTLALAPDDPRTPRIWRCRIDDLVRVIDELDRIEAAIPGLTGRVDRTRIAAAGHSWGATSVSALLGARVLDEDGNPGEDMSDSRVTAGVLLALAGTGGADLTPFAAAQFPFMNPDFSEMTTPALLVAGEKDQSLLSVRGADWWTDGYRQSPGAENLLTVFGAEHSLGGIVTHLAAKEMSDAESPEMLALVQRVTTAYLRRALGLGDEDWAQIQAALADDAEPLGRLESK